MMGRRASPCLPTSLSRPFHLTPSLLLSALFLFYFLFFSFFAPWPAHSAAAITHLPGFPGRLPFHLETGYVEVDEVNGAELFYYFIESEGNPSEDPVFLWLTGGPRCSAFSGLVIEIGPLKFVSVEYNGSLPNLEYRPYSWTQVANVIFVDSPVGSGFSFSQRAEGYNANDMSWTEQTYTFLIKWFIDHPQFLSNPLYITGDSYAGKIVPIVAHKISKGAEVGEKHLNLKGYIIGNPVTGEKVDINSRVPYAHGVGIISDDLFELIERSCEGQDHRNPSSAQCALCLDIFAEFRSEIYENHILEPLCALASPKPKNMVQNRRTLKDYYVGLVNPPPVPDNVKCKTYPYFLSYYWANSILVRRALHIKEGTVEEWMRCNFDLPYTYEVNSSLVYQLNITTRGYRALVYSGDHDEYVPFVGTKAWIKSLNFSIVDDWRSWHVDGQVAGYTMTYRNNLTFATVKGGGHTAPEYRPKECLAMVQRWISHKPL